METCIWLKKRRLKETFCPDPHKPSVLCTAPLKPFDSIPSSEIKLPNPDINQTTIPHLSQQFEHFGRLLRLLVPKKPLDLADPRHASHIGTVVGFPQHPWQLVGLEHQGGEQELPASTSVALSRAVIPRAPSLGQFALKIETSLSGQLGTHHSWEDVSEVVEVERGVLQHHAKTSHLTCSEVFWNASR